MKRYINSSVKNLYSDSYEARETTAKTTSHVDVLQALAFDTDYGVRMAVASNPATDVDTLRMLAEDSNYYVRAEVVGNPNAATPEIMATLLKHCTEDYYIRDLIANCPASGPDTLAYFAKWGSVDEKISVINNPNVPVSIVLELFDDYDADVSWAARQKLDKLREDL